MIYEITSAPVQPHILIKRSVPMMHNATEAPFPFEDKYEEIDMPSLIMGRRVRMRSAGVYRT